MRMLIGGQQLNKYMLHFQEKRRQWITGESDGVLQKKKQPRTRANE